MCVFHIWQEVGAQLKLLVSEPLTLIRARVEVSHMRFMLSCHSGLCGAWNIMITLCGSGEDSHACLFIRQQHQIQADIQQLRPILIVSCERQGVKEVLGGVNFLSLRLDRDLLFMRWPAHEPAVRRLMCLYISANQDVGGANSSTLHISTPKFLSFNL